MSEIHDECGVAAIYHLPDLGVSPLCSEQGPEEISRLMPRMLLDIQNRGQLAAGISTYNPNRKQLVDTYKDVGNVSEVFRLSHRGKFESLMEEYAGRAAIGHVRYATCGQDDRSYAQPFERHHSKSTNGSVSPSTGNWPTTWTFARSCSTTTTTTSRARPTPKC